MFFDIPANETAGFDVPIEFKTAEVVSGHKLGVFLQAGIVKIFDSVKK